MVFHVVGIEEGHLLLNGAKDTGIACMEAHDVFALVIELFHHHTVLRVPYRLMNVRPLQACGILSKP